MPPVLVDVEGDAKQCHEVPEEWGCKREDAKVGFFAVLEVVYDGDEKGISVAQVCISSSLCLVMLFAF